jgi:hypothetical protein
MEDVMTSFVIEQGRVYNADNTNWGEHFMLNLRSFETMSRTMSRWLTASAVLASLLLLHGLATAQDAAPFPTTPQKPIWIQTGGGSHLLNWNGFVEIRVARPEQTRNDAELYVVTKGKSPITRRIRSDVATTVNDIRTAVELPDSGWVPMLPVTSNGVTYDRYVNFRWVSYVMKGYDNVSVPEARLDSLFAYSADRKHHIPLGRVRDEATNKRVRASIGAQ